MFHPAPDGLNIRVVENGFIVSEFQRGDEQPPAHVFTSPADLGRWIATWGAERMVVRGHDSSGPNLAKRPSDDGSKFHTVVVNQSGDEADGLMRANKQSDLDDTNKARYGFALNGDVIPPNRG